MNDDINNPEIEDEEDLAGIPTVTWVLAIIILIFIPVLLPRLILNYVPDSRKMENSVKELRKIGAIQLAYSTDNNMRAYASLEALQTHGYIGEESSHINIIEGYSLEWSTRLNLTKISSWEYDADNGFTILAYPKRKKYSLKTFCIREDQIVRVYDPGNPDTSFDKSTTWDPVI